jgi:hypothetical protein
MGSISGTVYDENGDPVEALVIAIPNLGDRVVTSGFETTTINTSTYHVSSRQPYNTFVCVSDDTTGAYNIVLPKAEWTLLFMKPDGTPLLNNIAHRVIAA